MQSWSSADQREGVGVAEDSGNGQSDGGAVRVPLDMRSLTRESLLSTPHGEAAEVAAPGLHKHEPGKRQCSQPPIQPCPALACATSLPTVAVAATVF